MTLDDAIYIILSAANVAVTDNNINAFKNYSANSQWCKATIRASYPYIGLSNNPLVQEALQVLQSNGIAIDNNTQNI